MRKLIQKNEHFRRLWLGGVISSLGDWFNTIAMYTAVQSITSSAQALAAVLIAKTLPAMLIAPIAGPLIDRVDRKRLLLWLDYLRALSVLGLILSYQRQSLAGLYASLVLMMLFSGIAHPAKAAVVPMIVKKESLLTANSLDSGTWSIMLALGSALGGIATELFGVTWALVIDGASFLISAWIFRGLPKLPAPKAKRLARERLWPYLKRAPKLRGLVSLKPLMSLSTGAIVLVPLFAERQALVAVTLALGGVYMARGLGAVVGSLLPGLPRWGDQAALWFGFAAIGVGLLVASQASLPFVAGGYFIAGTGSGAIWVSSSALLQARAEPSISGRLFSLEFGAMTLVFSMSGWLLSALVDAGYSPGRVAQLAALPALAIAALRIVQRALSAFREVKAVKAVRASGRAAVAPAPGA